MRNWILAVCVLGLAVGAARGASDVDERAALASGLALLDEAVRARAEDPDRAMRLARDAAVLIEDALPDGGIRNPAAQRALGNAWLIGGDLGRAVLAYRRAERLAPEDPIVRSSLAHARALVDAEPPRASGGVSWRGVLLAWRGVVPRGVLFWTGVGLAAGACWAVAWRIVAGGPRRLVGAAVPMLTLGAACLALVLAEPAIERSPGGVVLREASGRTGPHASIYPPALERAVPAGAEVRVLDARDGWLLCEIGAARAWLPGDAVERVAPAS